LPAASLLLSQSAPVTTASPCCRAKQTASTHASLLPCCCWLRHHLSHFGWRQPAQQCSGGVSLFCSSAALFQQLLKAHFKLFAIFAASTLLHFCRWLLKVAGAFDAPPALGTATACLGAPGGACWQKSLDFGSIRLWKFLALWCEWCPEAAGSGLTEAGLLGQRPLLPLPAPHAQS
jgi:hypothetical protein